MTGPEHYREAEAHLASAAQNFMQGDDPTSALAAAQVHATLALAAATALSAPDRGASVDDVRADRHAWEQAAGVEPARGGAADA